MAYGHEQFGGMVYDIGFTSIGKIHKKEPVLMRQHEKL
jgi:hypothetical protein